VVEALANAIMEPGLQFQVQDNLGKPFAEISYRCDKVVFRGSSDGESRMSIEGSRAFSELSGGFIP